MFLHIGFWYLIANISINFVKLHNQVYIFVFRFYINVAFYQTNSQSNRTNPRPATRSRNRGNSAKPPSPKNSANLAAAPAPINPPNPSRTAKSRSGRRPRTTLSGSPCTSRCRRSTASSQSLPTVRAAVKLKKNCQKKRWRPPFCWPRPPRSSRRRSWQGSRHS